MGSNLWTSFRKIVRDEDILIIGSIDWSVHRQTNQRLASAFAEAGNRVLFVENTGVRAPRLGDIGRIRDRVRRWLHSTKGFTDVQPNVTVLSPVLLPWPYARVARVINRYLLSRAILQWMRSARFGRPIVITFLPTPVVQAVIKDIEPSLLIYYCANDMAGPSPANDQLRRWEDRLFRDADAVFVISEALRERATRLSKNVYSYPAGVEFPKFETARLSGQVPSDLAALPRPVVGYVGAVSAVFDEDLVVEMAARLPGATFALVGPTYRDVSRLAALPNVRLLGERPHDEIPSYIKGFDVALIPYLKTPYTDSVYSCKLNEYLAMGVPVVSTDMREIRHFVERHGPVVEIGRNADDFIQKVSAALASDPASASHARIEVGQANSWDRRFAELEAVVERHLHERVNAGRAWQSRLLGSYRRHRVSVVSRVSALLVAYALVFHTPVVWLAGDMLTVRDSPRPADAIVVFSGNGESSYINPSYQRRARDAAQYYRAGYAPLLIISSGIEQTFSEVEIIRALLLSQGVPQAAMHIVSAYPRSTYDNVRIVQDVLKARGAKSILLITAPYHSRRASLIWHKVAPEVSVTTVPVVDTPPARPQWSATTDQIRTIAYEYMAIAYNRTKGWL